MYAYMQLSSSFYRDKEKKKKGIDHITINTIILHNLKTGCFMESDSTGVGAVLQPLY